MLNVSRDFAPPFKMIEPFFKYGSIFYLLSLISLLFIDINAPLDDFKIVGFAHLFLLGFVMIVIFGAMAQLIPVALEVGHFSIDLYYVIFPTLFFGTILLVSGFWFSPSFIPYGATLVFVSMAIFLFETLMTLKKTTTNTLTVKAIKYGNYFLTAAIIIGLLMAVAIANGIGIDITKFLPIHAVLVIFGYVTITIIGFSMILLPMFGLAHGYDDRDVNLAFKIITYSVVAFSIFKLLSLDFLANLTLVAIVAALFLYLKQLLILYKIRARKILDIWYQHIYVAFISMIAGVLVGVIGYFFELSNFLKAGIWLYLMGFFVFIINGHLLKIIPFLVWFERFSPLVGKKKVPMLHEMLPQKDCDFSFYFSVAGLIVATLGLLFENEAIFKGGVTLFIFGAIFMLKIVIYILNYKEEDYV
ncbi:MAG: hypothetical protein GXN91_02510 [Epsilonproteobacteria bacterium]|nr:hypothetical protein [Campylobacterota bacterium]